MEEAASYFGWYESELIHGLLQTEDYARAVIRAGNPGADDKEIEQRVHVRMARQALLTRSLLEAVLLQQSQPDLADGGIGRDCVPEPV